MKDLLLNAPFDLVTAAPIAAAAGASSGGGKRCKIAAYSGGPIRQEWSDEDIYIDLQGVSWPSDKSLPILREHSKALEDVLGNTTAIQIDATSGLTVDAYLNGVTDTCKTILAQAKAGVQFQASVGAFASAGQRLRPGEVSVVNGRQVEGPALIVRKTRLREISVVATGADDNTQFVIAASAASTKEPPMSAPIAAAAGTAAPLAPTAPAPAAVAAPVAPVAGDAGTVTAPVAAGAVSGLDTSAIAKEVAQILRNDASIQQIRASRPQAPAVHVPGAPEFSAMVIQAAACQAGKLPNLEAHFDEKTLDAAHKQFKSGISLCEIIHASAVANGYSGRNTFRDAGAGRAMLQAAWSSHDIADILSATVNKFLLNGFTAVDNSYRMIAARRQVVDFKKVTSYRLTGGFKFEELSGKGELQHAKAGNLKYENSARTYGIQTSISREQLINDDLGALADIPKMIGRGAALKLNEVFWKTFLDNSSVFTSGNKNYTSGSASKLDIDGITAVEQLFLDQTDPDGFPLGVSPEILLVPTALNVKARSFMSSAEIRDTTSNKNYATTNPHAGKYQPVTSPYLSNASFTGYSSTAYYLIANPETFPLIEACFLNGVEQPTVEQAEADFSLLGIQMRGFFDFGVAFVDPRAGAKSAGA
jgi:phage major head subunit gpT-like protein